LHIAQIAFTVHTMRAQCTVTTRLGASDTRRIKQIAAREGTTPSRLLRNLFNNVYPQSTYPLVTVAPATTYVPPRQIAPYAGDERTRRPWEQQADQQAEPTTKRLTDN